MAEATSVTLPVHTISGGRTFFGQPPALGFLAFTEAWERFSYYGMTSLLVLYMSQSLFMPAHVGHIAGFAAYRAGLESVFGKMSTLALASQTYRFYTGFVYFTPLIGGWIADRFIGRRNAVVTGAILMSGGHSLLYKTILGVAFIWQWPTLLALVSRIAPQRLKSTLMGAAFLTLFVSNTTIGRIGGLYEHITPAEFWLMNACIAAIGAVLAFLLRKPLGRALEQGVEAGSQA